jgi:hypothetical protein
MKNKMHIFKALALFSLFATSCNQDINPSIEELPACVKADMQDPRISAKKVYVVTGRKTYYLVEMDCCDALNPVYDADCNLVCQTGGLSGKGEGECPEAVGETDKLVLVWEK